MGHSSGFWLWLAGAYCPLLHFLCVDRIRSPLSTMGWVGFLLLLLLLCDSHGRQDKTTTRQGGARSSFLGSHDSQPASQPGSQPARHAIFLGAPDMSAGGGGAFAVRCVTGLFHANIVLCARGIGCGSICFMNWCPVVQAVSKVFGQAQRAHAFDGRSDHKAVCPM